MRASGMKGKVPWPRARLRLNPRWFGRLQLSVSTIEAEDHDFVCSEITGVSELVRSIEDDAMGMRTFLASPVDARPLVLFHVGCCAQTAIMLNRENRNVAATVIRRQYKFSARVHFYVTGAGAERRLLVQWPQSGGSLVNRKCRDCPAFLAGKLIDFVDRVEVTPTRRKSQIRRINYLPGRAVMP